MFDEDRPSIRALIGWLLPGGDVILSQQNTIPLEDAPLYQKWGFVILVDPADESDLASWEREHRWASLRRWL